MSTNITVTGNLTRDPELRFTQNGTAVANFTVAVNSRRKDGDQWVDGETTYYPTTVWGEQAEHVTESLTTGARVTVTGRIGARSFETREGEKQTRLEVVADEVSASLRWATATITKVARGRADEAPVSEDAPF